MIRAIYSPIHQAWKAWSTDSALYAWGDTEDEACAKLVARINDRSR